MAGCRAAVAALALLACASLTAARSQRRGAKTRRGLSENDWIDAKVINRCSEPIVFRAGYTFFDDQDKGHPCPNKLPSGKGLHICSTDWITIDSNSSAVVPELPVLLWWYSSFVEDADPPLFLSKKSDAAWLADPEDFKTACTEPKEDSCVWWDTPKTNKDDKTLVLRCPELSPAALAAAAAAANDTTPVELSNDCSQPVDVKVAYTLPEGVSGEGCAIDTWLGKDNHLCVTDWFTLEAGETRTVADAGSDFYSYGAHVAGDRKADLAKGVVGAYQGSNETTSCPEKSLYGSFDCEWWAPSFVSGTSFDASKPVSISCPDYSS